MKSEESYNNLFKTLGIKFKKTFMMLIECIIQIIERLNS